MKNLDAKCGWLESEELPSKEFTCYSCGSNICSDEGYKYIEDIPKEFPYFENTLYIYICHKCKAPTHFNKEGKQVPGSLYGENVLYLPQDVGEVYNEARKCFSVKAFTSAVLCCRKILMNISCEKGADEGKKFEYYVNYLNDKGYIPPDGKEWVDKIRKLGNQATHKLEIKSQEDAELAINFTSMLLKLIYEFPNLLKV
ncbi:DUF4145 domain-containing protein [Clostridium algidicarnis]|uniref:DUF4145 domain-containing protein n=1 Tax=Clostridium algidicarnis TaxID=37659 RepID=UPI003FD7CD49